MLRLEIKSCDWVCSFSNQFFLYKNKPIKLNTTFCCDNDFLIRISLNFGQSYIFYYLLSKHIFFPRGMLWRGKNVVYYLLPFWRCRSGWYLLGLEGKKLLMKRLQYLTLIELLIFRNAKGYEKIARLLILWGRTEDVWSASSICTLQQQWGKKIPLIIRLLLRGIGNSWFDQDF